MNINDLAKVQLGQNGSIYHAGTDTLTCGVTGLNFLAITFVTDTNFAAASGLVSVDNTRFVNSETAATAIDSDGDVVDAAVFPAGMTIYGKWSQIILDSGSIIAYIG
jgi:hypothetical protein